jgi:3-phenylpropionate/trans-cinnamate dioxygenase ferredoxin reductase subunit
MTQDIVTRTFDCIIVGAGHGGCQTAVALRQAGFKGSIALLGAEPEVPYDRPSLSKEYLAGKKTFERMHLRPQDFWSSRNVELVLRARVVTVDAVAKTVTLEDGTRYSYRNLIWAAGGDPRKLSCSGSELSGIFYIRSKADCDALLAVLPDVAKVAIIGGGYVGLEAAAVFRELGKDVVLVEALDRVLARVAAEPMSRFYEREHRDHGVDIRLNSGVKAILERDGRSNGILLESGGGLEADIVVVGIGIVPCAAPLLTAGARGGNGVDVDEYCRTSLPDVYCVGDCA